MAPQRVREAQRGIKASRVNRVARQNPLVKKLSPWTTYRKIYKLYLGMTPEKSAICGQGIGKSLFLARFSVPLTDLASGTVSNL